MRLPPFFCFDLDGTVTSEEILPRIASALRLETQMAKLTTQAMAGDIPFDVSLTRRVAMLKSLPISTVTDIVMGVGLNHRLVEFLRENSERCAIVTGNLDVWIAPLMKQLGIRYFCSNAEYEGDRLIGVKKILSKADACIPLPRPLVAIGDGNNDFGMLENADIGIAFGGVHRPAESLLDVATHAIYTEEELCRFLRQLF